MKSQDGIGRHRWSVSLGLVVEVREGMFAYTKSELACRAQPDRKLAKLPQTSSAERRCC